MRPLVLGLALVCSQAFGYTNGTGGKFAMEDYLYIKNQIPTCGIEIKRNHGNIEYSDMASSVKPLFDLRGDFLELTFEITETIGAALALDPTQLYIEFNGVSLPVNQWNEVFVGHYVTNEHVTVGTHEGISAVAGQGSGHIMFDMTVDCDRI